MFGIDDPAVWMAFVMCLAATAVCIIYGIRHWNHGDDDLSPRDQAWARQERKVEDKL